MTSDVHDAQQLHQRWQKASHSSSSASVDDPPRSKVWCSEASCDVHHSETSGGTHQLTPKELEFDVDLDSWLLLLQLVVLRVQHLTIVKMSCECELQL